MRYHPPARAATAVEEEDVAARHKEERMRSRSVHRAIAGLIIGMAILSSSPAARAADPAPGPNNAITDVPGIRVGHYTNGTTGATVVLGETTTGGGVGGSVTQRGGAPGTRETDLLRPENMVTIVNAVVLSGGGPYGLAVASGVMACLEARATGFGVGGGNVVPIVPAAVFMEPACGSGAPARPDFSAGMTACQAAATGPVAQGNVGAGAGAAAGGIKGGIGTASIVLPNGVIVGALVAVNSLGWAHDAVGLLYDNDAVGLGEFDELRRGFTGKTPKPALPAAAAFPGRGTLAVVATNVTLTKAQAIKIAEMADDGLARAIRPVHTPFDADTLFTLGTGRITLASLGDPALVQNQIGAAAADVVARAVRHALIEADSTACFKNYCDTFATACRVTKENPR
jgi:L-aminopeptidase/D-esterase-like protein